MQSSAAIEASVGDVSLAAGGDVPAFERLYRTHVARIHGLARRMVGPDDADDLTQEVFVRAWDTLATSRGESVIVMCAHDDRFFRERGVRARQDADDVGGGESRIAGARIAVRIGMRVAQDGGGELERVEMGSTGWFEPERREARREVPGGARLSRRARAPAFHGIGGDRGDRGADLVGINGRGRLDSGGVAPQIDAPSAVWPSAGAAAPSEHARAR